MNNFDRSSSGVNLELSIDRDYDLSEMYFDDELAQVNDFNVNTFLFTGGIISNEIDFTDLDLYKINKTKKTLFIDFIKENISYYTSDLNNLSKDHFNKYFNKLTKGELLEIIENECSENLTEFLVSSCNPKFNIFSVCGYSQGDYAEVIILDSMLKEYNVKSFDEFYEKMHDFIEHLFYDAPICARLEIDEKEFYIDEHLNDIYSYDKDEILAICNKHIKHNKKSYIIDFLEQNLPENL